MDKQIVPHTWGWRHVFTDNDVFHVKPYNDLIAHPSTEDCACGPTVTVEQRDGQSDLHIVSHHALDSRQ